MQQGVAVATARGDILEGVLSALSHGHEMVQIQPPAGRAAFAVFIAIRAAILVPKRCRMPKLRGKLFSLVVRSFSVPGRFFGSPRGMSFPHLCALGLPERIVLVEVSVER